MRWGRKWGNYWGDDRVTVLTIRDLENRPPEAILSWESARPGAIYHVYVDGKLYTITSSTSAMVQFKSIGRHWFEVFISGAGNTYETLDQYLTDIPGTRVKLSWLASIGANHYKIYWNEGLGSFFSYLSRTKANETTWISQELPNGTYKFRVDPVDDAGNQATSSSIITVIVAKYPNPASNLRIASYADGIANFAFTESTTPPSITGYRIYHNNGSGNIDYGTIRKTIPYGSTTFTLNIGSGSWKVAIRAYNASHEEDNIDVVTEFRITGSPAKLLTNPPNIPIGLYAKPAQNGTIALECNYYGIGEKTKGTSINFYRNNGADGEINYGAAIASAAIPGHIRGENIIVSITATTPPLTNGKTYIFAAKSVNIDGSESEASSTATATADSSSPLEVQGLTGEAVLYES